MSCTGLLERGRTSLDSPEKPVEFGTQPVGETDHDEKVGINLPLLDPPHLFDWKTAVFAQLVLSKAVLLTQGLNSFTEFLLRLLECGTCMVPGSRSRQSFAAGVAVGLAARLSGRPPDSSV